MDSTNQFSDLLQDYLSSTQLKFGLNPYESLIQLQKQYLPLVKQFQFFHPTPHQPASLFLFIPLTFVSYKTASIIWYCLQLVTFFCIFWKLSGDLGIVNRVPIFRFYFCIILIGSDPVRMELMLGQWNYILLALVTLYLSLPVQKTSLKILCLTLLMSIKSIGVLFILALCNKKNIKLFLLFLLFSGVINVSLSIMYPNVIAGYKDSIYETILFYLEEPANASLWAGLYGVLDIVGIGQGNIQIRFWMISVFISLVAVWWVISGKRFTDKYCFFLFTLSGSLLLLPILWPHALILLIPPTALLFASIRWSNIPERYSILGIGLILFWYFSRQPVLFLTDYFISRNIFSNIGNIIGSSTTLFLLLVMIYVRELDRVLLSEKR
jgi:hypothetical protein